MDLQPSQPPPPRITIEEIVVWIDDRKKFILGVIGVIGLAGLAFVIYNSNESNKEHRAAAALFQLQTEQGNSTNEPSAADYRALLAQTEGTGISQHVRLREATSLYAAGKYADAQSAFEGFVRDFPDSPLLPEAGYGVATSLEAQGKKSDALNKYQELTTRFPQSAFVDRARIAQARIYEQEGDQKQAFRIYQELASRASATMAQMGQPSALQIDASIAMRRLVKENPGLMQTNAPSATPSIAPTELPKSATNSKPAGS